jgi:hypothetical protein
MARSPRLPPRRRPTERFWQFAFNYYTSRGRGRPGGGNVGYRPKHRAGLNCHLLGQLIHCCGQRFAGRYRRVTSVAALPSMPAGLRLLLVINSSCNPPTARLGLSSIGQLAAAIPRQTYDDIERADSLPSCVHPASCGGPVLARASGVVAATAVRVGLAGETAVPKRNVSHL